MRKTATLPGSAVMIAAFAAPATAAVGEIRVSPGENIAGSFVVKLKDDAVTASAQTLGSRFGGQVVSIQATQVNPPSWGLDRIDQRNLPLDQRYTYNSTGSGVNAYIIDTGVRVTHSDFGGRARNGRDLVDNDAVAQDGNGHGTHVAGTVAGTLHGVAKQVARYLQGNRNVTPAQVATAITSNATSGKVTNPGPSTTTRLLHWAPTS